MAVALVLAGMVLVVLGLVSLVRPLRDVGIQSRARGGQVLFLGVAVMFGGASQIEPESGIGGRRNLPPHSDSNLESVGVDSAGTSIESGDAEYTLDIEVVEHQVYDAPIKVQVIEQLLVSGDINVESLEATLLKEYERVKKLGPFDYGAAPSHVFLYAYETKERAHSKQALHLAMLRSIDGPPEVSVIDDERLALVHAPPEVRFGLTEKERKAVYWELLQAEDRANAEADAQVPGDEGDFSILKRRAAISGDIRKGYEAEIHQRLGLSVDQAKEIIGESYQRRWVPPPWPTD